MKSRSWETSGTARRMAVAAIQRSPSWSLFPSECPACWHRIRSSAQAVISAVVWLHDGDLPDSPFESPASQVAPPSSERAEAQLHDGLEGEQDGLRADELAVLVGERVGAFVEQPTDDHGVHDDARYTGVGHVSASASWNAFHSSSVMSSTTSRSRGGNGRANFSASAGA